MAHADQALLKAQPLSRSECFFENEAICRALGKNLFLDLSVKFYLIKRRGSRNCRLHLGLKSAPVS